MQQERVEEMVKAFLKKYNLYRKTFVVGFSGGYDSACTLDVLSKLEIKLIAAHYNHGWRVEADEEEERCREFCNTRGIEFCSERASKDLKKTETAAREARYEFFERVLKKYNADGIFTAHNSDDNAETVIYRIIKGTGIAGLKGIQPVRGNIYRPIINCSRAEIEEYCKTRGIIPNIDSSNFDIKYKRNFIRHEIIPKMEEINAELKSAVNKLSELARLDDEIIGEYIGIASEKAIEENRIIIPEFLKLSNSVKQKIIYLLLSKHLEEYDFKRVKECLEFILENCSQKKEKKKSLTTGVWLVVNNRECSVHREETQNRREVTITGSGEYDFAPYKLIIEETAVKPDKFPDDNSGTAYVDLSNINLPLTLRHGKSSDIIKPFGMSGRMVLKKYLSGRNIAAHRRKSIPVLACGDEILWVPQIGLSSSIAVKNKPTHLLKFTEN